MLRPDFVVGEVIFVLAAELNRHAAKLHQFGELAAQLQAAPPVGLPIIGKGHFGSTDRPAAFQPVIQNRLNDTDVDVGAVIIAGKGEQILVEQAPQQFVFAGSEPDRRTDCSLFSTSIFPS